MPLAGLVCPSLAPGSSVWRDYGPVLPQVIGGHRAQVWIPPRTAPLTKRSEGHTHFHFLIHLPADKWAATLALWAPQPTLNVGLGGMGRKQEPGPGQGPVCRRSGWS